MANLTIRRNKGAALTHDELDNNFVALNNDIIDSSQIINLIDSDYVQARQITYDFLDSAEAIALIDSAYVNARVNLANSLDSAEVIALIDSAYVQARQITYDFLDSAEVINLVDSAYVQSRVTLRDSSFITSIVDSGYVTGLIDSHVTNLIDSDYISNRSSVTTSSVTTAFANVTPLAVGSMVICNNFSGTIPGTTLSIGGTVAGSYLMGVNQSNSSYYNIGATGTWKNLGSGILKYNVGGFGSLLIRIA